MKTRKMISAFVLLAALSSCGGNSSDKMFGDIPGIYEEKMVKLVKNMQEVDASSSQSEALEMLADFAKEMEELEKEMAQWKQQDEDVLTYALFPQVATDFFKYREAQQKKVDATVADTKNGAYPV